MTKQELITFINTLTADVDGRVTFLLHETLNTQQPNTRTVNGSKERLTTLFADYFDDNLYGHFKDNVMTTILSYENISE
jgi:hypothetical protein